MINRIVIIGNGFDLAHGLETSYKQFIDYLWREEDNKFTPYNFDYCIDLDSGLHYKYESDFIRIRVNFPIVQKCVANGYGYDWFKNLNNRDETQVTIKNSFLETISERSHLQNWVDIEKEYYHELKECSTGKRVDGIKKLNEEFFDIKTALERYLENILETIPPNEKISNHLEIYEKSIDNVIFLNFNYTSIIKNYGVSEEQIIYIHGKLNDPNNPIIFGYGDELNENYKLIENQNDNEYFKNMKSMEYLKTGNNTKLQALIDSDEYEIFIMGHSCGISDRTLLKNLFEHKNCQSIRIFYHNDNNSDNYIDLVNNISRIFDDKNAMRRKVVSKDKSEPLL
jgi:hypothetical protein